MKEQIIGLIGGTGLGDALAEHITDITKKRIQTPYGAPTVFRR